MADLKLRLQFLEGKPHKNEELKTTTKDVLTQKMSHIPQTTATYSNLTQWYESVTLELGNVNETGIIEYLEKNVQLLIFLLYTCLLCLCTLSV